MKSREAHRRGCISKVCSGRQAKWLIRVFIAIAATLPALLRSEDKVIFSIPSIGGAPIEIPLTTIDPNGSLLPPPDPEPQPPKAPTIFSAPLPSGSGARALGVAGAFTAIADDATAASWNPAGLTQLERPELSFVYRLKHDGLSHWSKDPNFQVGDDGYENYALNYLSAVLPLRLFDHTAVVSLNYQEVYDFSSKFHANFSESTTSPQAPVTTDAYYNDIKTDEHDEDRRDANGNGYVLHLTETFDMHKTTVLDQTLYHTTNGELDFEQEGSVQAITPAFAFQVTSKLSLGMALNVYQEGLLGSSMIKSRTSARYSGSVRSDVTTTDTRDLTDGHYTYVADYYPQGLPPLIGIAQGTGDIDDQSFTETSFTSTTLNYTGSYTLYDRINNFRGINATFGSLLTVNEKLTLGFCLDLPWTAKAHQTTTTSSSVTLDDASNTTITSTTRESHDIEFDFPLYWAAGAVWHWNNRLTTSFDVSQTWWSDYSFKVNGDTRKNPLDGSEYGDRPIDDCWALRTGTEYLLVLEKTEIPFRVGFSWDQRPAIGRPDEYWGISLGSGISIGKGPNKVIIDVAYQFTWGNDVMDTLVPSQEGSMGTDVQRHELFLSCIYHF